MRNGRCRIHGGLSPGARPGNQNALKHGHWSREMIELRRAIRVMRRDLADDRYI
ncbi:hypothetical protein [Sphingomonas sp. Leaf33]|uniref:hypothetical protein n=1 Tax=Sphingomonas sp. Leaf33 TaxID=1736215 RepID=UPI0039E165C1